MGIFAITTKLFVWLDIGESWKGINRVLYVEVALWMRIWVRKRDDIDENESKMKMFD